ncbi:ribonucleoprotein [Cystobacter fuscus]|uniref:Ribonucleoprotein n=1 Tax=Cystobacter fuscus TaxID=43 RepID=A0A250JKT6_9BACT|nr:TROVE domain-containing protein [Cystobacter fuscus]ATB44011.1 ribonucleoprotein [Cystobacter fuscus]
MANLSLFQTTRGPAMPRPDALNEEGAPAFSFTPRHALAQYAATGCLNGTFYAAAEVQLDQLLALSGQVEPEFVARTALYCRHRGYMKDTPALLCAVLSVLGPELLPRVFPRVIDNGRMLRTFVQIMRSGLVARRSLGSLPKRLVREWLDARDEDTLFRDSVGQSPSLADIIRMVHPKPKTARREAFYGYLLGRPHAREALPELVAHYEDFKVRPSSREVPEVPFQLLTSLPLKTAAWVRIAQGASWQMTRMNLNTFARHGVFGESGMEKMIARRLADPAEVRRARVFPYQLLATWRAVGRQVPARVRDAVEEAMEVAIENVPRVDGRAYVCVDVSGSMQSPVTGHREGATTAVRCVDVAALLAAAMLRRNPGTQVVPFDHDVVPLTLHARDSIMTNAQRLAAVGGGGTSCSAPLAWLNARQAKGELVIFVSDNESWVDARAGAGTETLRQWELFRRRNPNARLMCIDLQPYRTTQAPEREDILNVGGFSDVVFELMSDFARGGLDARRWVESIESTGL